MYPEAFPHPVIDERDRGLIAENLVYDKLKEKLPDNWVVLYNQWRYYIDNAQYNERYENYEADFFVLVPGKGIAVLEVKSWFQPRIRNGRWERRSGDSYEPCDKGSPLNQANIAASALRKELLKAVPVFGAKYLECRPLAILYGTADNYEEIGFCDADSRAVEYIRQNNAESFRRFYVVGNEALNNIRQQIENLFVCNNCFTEEQIGLVCEHLLQNVRFKTNVSACVAMMDSATSGLDVLLPCLEHSLKGIHVSGCAGSGKTWMACKEIIRLHQKMAQNENKKILFLCYNRNLADYVSGCLLKNVGAREVDGFSPVQVSTFHSLCIQLCRWGGIQYRLEQDDIISEETLKAIRSYVRRENKYRYDYIFVDEAQDIRDDWWDFVITEMKKKAETLLYVFSDSNQLLYNNGQEVISLPVQIELKKNLRNALDIAQMSTAVLPPKARDIIPLPLKTDKYCCYLGLDTPQERAAKVQELIQQILDTNNGIGKKDIVVLSPYNNNSSFNYLQEDVDIPVAGENIETTRSRIRRCNANNAKKVYGETIKSFKGLESPFVILTDINRPREDNNSGFTPNDFYVACTRAKYGLYIVPTKNGESYVREIEQVAANLPSPLD